MTIVAVGQEKIAESQSRAADFGNLRFVLHHPRSAKCRGSVGVCFDRVIALSVSFSLSLRLLDVGN